MSDLKRAFDNAVSASRDRTRVQGRLGKLESDGSYTIRVSGKPGWVHVRRGPEGKGGTTIARNAGVAERANLPVEMRRERGEWVVRDVDVATAVIYTGTGGDTGNVGPHTHRRDSGLSYEIEMERLDAGRVKPWDGGMVVYITPFRYQKTDGTWVTWLGGTIDLTSYQPSTAGNWAWVLVGVDPSDNTATATKGTEYSYATPLTLDLIDDITWTDKIPCAAIKVREDDTALTDWRDYEDAHVWFGGAGSGNITGPVSSTDNAIARWNGTGGDTLQDSTPTIDDSGNLDMQGGQIQDYAEEALAATVSSTPYDIDWSLSSERELTLETSPTFTFSNLAAGKSMTLVLIQDGTGSRTVTWPVAVSWISGSAPTLQTAASSIDVIVLFVREDGGSVLGAHVGASSITGPGSSTDNAVPRWDGTGGDTLQNSGVTIDDSGRVTLPVMSLGTPTAGLLEYDGNSLEFTPTADRRSISMADGVVVEDTTVANTTTETTIYTESISANEFFRGAKWHTRISGYYSTANASDIFTFRLKIGGTTVITLTSTAKNVTDGFWRAEFFFTVRTTGASGTIQAAVEAVFDDDANNVANTTTTSIDTTVADDITATVQWDNALTGNTFTLTQGHSDVYGVTTAGDAWTVGTSQVGGTDAIS